MTTPIHDAINYCEDCGLQHAAHRCAGCPLCPLRIELQKAWNELHDAEPYRVIENSNFWQFQDNLNEITAAGWDVRNIHLDWALYQS